MARIRDELAEQDEAGMIQPDALLTLEQACEVLGGNSPLPPCGPSMAGADSPCSRSGASTSPRLPICKT